MSSISRVAIIDYGMGNLFSINQACETLGFHSVITQSSETIKEADALILPGVGAFGHAMEALTHLKLTDTIKQFANSERPVIGICLGAQLMFSRSQEFGTHKGLDLIPGEVVAFRNVLTDRTIKVPHIGWSRVGLSAEVCDQDKDIFDILDQKHMYFVHSFYLQPENENNVLTYSEYAGFKFCSAFHHKNIYGFQFHPEKSGADGLNVLNKFLKSSDKLNLSV